MLRRILLAVASVIMAPSLAAAAEDDKPGVPSKQDRGPQLRLIIVSCLEDQGPLKLMSKNDDGEWREHAEFKPRPSFITDWMPVPAGRLHLTVPGADGPQSVGGMTYPADTRRAIAVIFYDSGKTRYRADVIDPAKAGFRKGSTLVANYSSRVGAVSLGGGLMRVNPGGRRVLKPKAEENGMYRMLASYARKNEKPVLCYDRYVAANPEAREILLLLPDKTLGLGVFRLSEFGPFE